MTTATDIVLIAGGGFLAGGINAIAGGGSLVSFPALIAIGLPRLSANVTNTVSIFPGYVGGTIGYRRELAEVPHELTRLTPVAMAGAAVGSAVLLATSSAIFDAIVPLLVLFASVLLVLQPRIQRWVLGRPHDGFARSFAALALATFLAGAYGAYFGGGLGVLLLAVLGVFLDRSLQHTNALKGALSLVINLIALILFALFGPVHWWMVAVMAPMSLLGGWSGSHVARRLPARVLRPVIATFGVAVAITLALR
ncbi:MAG: sulfite exporter TauE/SafE family protein [Actinobacteria bacterium]|nr:sulfite exporter TauE/SafE family protein [Actinomycetota bacterium]